MADTPFTTVAPKLSASEPELFVSDIKAACGDIREREELLAASFTIDTAAEIKQLFQQYQAAGVDFFRPLKQEPWGARTFIVRDPDGNLLLFAGPHI
jgi:uncharacterized glyoxalase superfamily protein PhnB